MMQKTFWRAAPWLAGAAIALSLAGAACSKSSDTATTESSTTTVGAAVNAGPTIAVSELKFDPSAATVKTGQVVTWRNDGSAKHQIQEEAKADGKPDFESTLLKPGDTYQFTPADAGQYNYYCRIHPDAMRGTLTISN